ncbi:9164_t:CDS:10 [Dentiscutata heterogama]|uniref:9164_t:CDS:1 n=1 Tax=Dentiscutata heterogama TaxID=1316150 RepID=A0ACA9MEN6_9GLOM|nr:9164_t:CDS:10 [Dentiscutata heterogama]
MFALSNLKETSKDNDENSTTKYSVLETSSYPTSSRTKLPTKINSPLWNTWEFGFYYFIVTISVLLMFKVGHDLSKETHPNYKKYSWRLQDGWIFGRKVRYTIRLIPRPLWCIDLCLSSLPCFESFISNFFGTEISSKISKSAPHKDILFLRVFEGSIANPIITWIFNLGVLFLNEAYGNYKFGDLNENFAFLRNDRDLAPLTEKDRIIGPCFREDYSFIYYLSYALYAPLYLAGPIITYNNFIAQLRYPCEIDIKATLIYGIRLFIAIMIMEFMLHYTYVVAIVKSKAWDGDSPLELAMIGVLNLELVWLKLLIIWRFFRFWAMSDGIDTQENILRCMLNNYSTAGFWRSWHRSYYRWIIRYIYIPLGGNKRTTLNMLIIFIFVALWHDISLKLLAWGWLIWLFILPETIAKKLFSSQNWVDWPRYRHLCAVGAILNFLMMWAANLVGFVVGLDGMKVLFTSIFMTSTGLMELGIACIVLFGGAQILFEIREEEKRRGINSEIRF